MACLSTQKTVAGEREIYLENAKRKMVPLR